MIPVIFLSVYLLFLVVSNIGIYWSASNEKKRTEKLQHVDYIVVLGNKLQKDKPSEALINRLDEALELSAVFPEAMLLVSGGVTSGNSLSEAEVMKQYLVSHGVEKKRILTEDHSRNTRENIQFSKEMIGDGNTIIIVTNSFHMPRSLLIARDYDLGDVYGCPANNGSVSVTISSFFIEPVLLVFTFVSSLF